MGGPPLVGWLLVLVGAATGVSCLLRMRALTGVAPAAGERRVARAEGLKGLGMALMAVPGSALDQRPWGAPLFAVVFGAMAVWSVASLPRGRHAGHHVHLAVGAGAMVYMALAMAAAPGGMPGMAGMRAAHAPGIPVLTGLLMGYFAGYALWAGIRMLPAGRAPVAAGAAAEAGPVAGVLAGPELAAACRVSLGIGMFAMLLTM